MNRQLALDGFAMVPRALPSDLVTELRQALTERLPESGVAGIRALTAKVPCVHELARSPRLRALVEPVLGPEAQLVRSVLFTKSTATNWSVAWHQDLTIAVQTSDRQRRIRCMDRKRWGATRPTTSENSGANAHVAHPPRPHR